MLRAGYHRQKYPPDIVHVSNTSLPEPKPPPPRRFLIYNRLPSSALSATTNPIRFLTPPLPPRLHIPPTRTATTQSRLNQPRKNGKRRCRPHEPKHVTPNLGREVQLLHTTNDVPEDDEHDSCDNGGGRDEESVKKDEGRDGKGGPAGEEGQRREGDEDGGEDGGGEEKAKHGLRGDLDEIKNLVDVCGEIDYIHSVSFRQPSMAFSTPVSPPSPPQTKIPNNFIVQNVLESKGFQR